MIDCVSVENMRISDQKTIEQGISGRELILRAAYAIYQSVDWNGKITVITGSGNNGADGFALSELLHRNGFEVTVLKVSERLHDDCEFFARNAEKSGVRIKSFQSGMNMLDESDIIVDCMLGTGFSGPLRQNYCEVIKEINASNGYVISVDINSGMNGDTGEGSVVVSSNLTVAIQFIKKGMIQEMSGKYIDKLISVDIGIILTEKDNKILTYEEWDTVCKVFPMLTDNSFESNGIIYYKCPKWLDIK